MRLPSLERDYWALESAEARHAANPDSFWIPDLAERETLSRGTAAKLLFVIEVEAEGGKIETGVERMWVVVSEVLENGYIGRLTNTPASFAPEDGAYLREGCEVPFRAEHVIDIAQPPQEFVQDVLSAPPAIAWKDR